MLSPKTSQSQEIQEKHCSFIQLFSFLLDRVSHTRASLRLCYTAKENPGTLDPPASTS